jgi:hypothetical protein
MIAFYDFGLKIKVMVLLKFIFVINKSITKNKSF